MFDILNLANKALSEKDLRVLETLCSYIKNFEIPEEEGQGQIVKQVMLEIVEDYIQKLEEEQDGSGNGDGNFHQ